MAEYYEVPDFQLYELLERIYPHEIYFTGAGIYTRCPFGNHSTPGRQGHLRIYAGTADPVGPEKASPNNPKKTPSHGGYTCSCGAGGNAWDFLQRYKDLSVPGDPSFKETILFVCEKLSIDPETQNRDLSDRDRAGRLMREIESALRPIQFETPNQHYQRGENGSFQYRGVDPMRWLQVGVGELRDSDVGKLTETFSEEAFQAAGISKWKQIGYKWLSEGALILRPDPHHPRRPASLGVRRHEEKSHFNSEEPKYAKTKSSSLLLEESQYVFGLHYYSHNPPSSPVLYVVEGEFDALAFHARGKKNVVSIGGTPTKEQLSALKKTGRQIVFVFDGDSGGSQHARKIAETDPETQFILLPEEGDPDEMVQAHGTGWIEEIEPHTGLSIQMYSEGAYDGRAWAKNQKALAQKYAQKIVSRPSAYDETNVRIIAELSGLDPDYLKSWVLQKRNEEVLQKITDCELKLEL